MTMGFDSIPLRQFVDFNGPIGKFEYGSNGLATGSNGSARLTHLSDPGHSSSGDFYRHGVGR